jgi:hypothetical protein
MKNKKRYLINMPLLAEERLWAKTCSKKQQKNRFLFRKKSHLATILNKIPTRYNSKNTLKFVPSYSLV